MGTTTYRRHSTPPEWRHHMPVTSLSLLVMTSAVSVVFCYNSNVTSFKPLRKLSLMPIDILPRYKHRLQVEKLKAEILRGLNLSSVPDPSTKKPRKPVHVINVLPVPTPSPRRPLSSYVFSEPVDTKKKTADQLLFRVGIPRKKPASIDQVTLLLRLRSKQHSRRKHRRRQRPRKSRRPQFPALEGNDVQNDQRRRADNHSRHRKKARSRRKRRVKVLVQTVNKKSGRFKRVAVQRVVVDSKFHWITLPIPASVVSSALQSSNQSLVLRIRCKRCHKGGVSIDSAAPRKKKRGQGVESPRDLMLNPYRPYLVIFASKTEVASFADVARSRSARHVDGMCPPSSEYPTSCCAEPLHVSFRDLGWDHWIVHPEGFTTMLCRGGCGWQSTAKTGFGEEGSDFTTGQKEASRDGNKLLHEHHRTRDTDDWGVISGISSRGGSRDVEVGRCQPHGTSSLKVMYLDDNNSLTHAVIPNLIANTCSCVVK